MTHLQGQALALFCHACPSRSHDKQGAIATHLPPILERLNIDIDAWLLQTQHFEPEYPSRLRSLRLRH